MEYSGTVNKTYDDILFRIGKKTIPRRAETAIKHMLEHGFITTEILKEKYGYTHPPRAIRDVKDLGIPVITDSVKDPSGKTIARYKIGNRSEITRKGGRSAFPKDFKKKVSQIPKCRICDTALNVRYLQIDHKIPFEVISDDVDPIPANYMLLCASCNRTKSWSCENCVNWKEDKNKNVCETCYWANPGCHTHVAMLEIRRLDMTWQGNEVKNYRALFNAAKKAGIPLHEYARRMLKQKDAS